MAKKKRDLSVVLIDVYDEGVLKRKGIRFADSPTVTAVEQVKEFQAAQVRSGRTCKARTP